MKIKSYVDESLILAIGFTYGAIWKNLNERLRSEKCTFNEAIALIALFFEKKDTTPSVLSKAIGISPSQVSQCLSALEKRGLVRRTLSPADARSYQISVTPEGKKSSIRFIKIIDGMEIYFEKEFGKNPIRQFVQTTVKFRQAMDNRKD